MNSRIRAITALNWLQTDRKSFNWRSFLIACGALFLFSLALSVFTTTARPKLWLGPQTLVLGIISVCVGAIIALLARRFADVPNAAQLDRPVLSRPGIYAAIIACAGVSLLICRFCFDAFPNSGDEYGFLFQADTFLHGRLWNTPPADPILFEQNYVVARNGMWVSQYLPGWPAILALFEFVGLPAWMATPVCGAVLLLLLWAALRLECSSQSLIVALLLAYATSGFFLLNGATYFSHCASALMVVGGVVCMLRAERSDAWWWPAAAGAFVGFATLSRIDSGILVATAALAAWIEQGCKWRTLLFGLVGALPLLIVFCAYNAVITGNPLLIPTMWAGNLTIGANGLGGVEKPSLHLRLISQTFWRVGELGDTASLLLPALYLVALALRLRTRRLRFYDILPIVNFVLFLIFPDFGGFQMGPRYWFDGFVVMHMTVGSVFAQQPIIWQRFAVVCCLLMIPVSLARLPGQVQFESHVMRERSTVFRLVQDLPTDGQTIVLVGDFYSAWNDRFNRTSPNLAKDFARNGIDLDKRVLFARGDLPDALERACTAYPDAKILKFHLGHAHPDGWLEPMQCHQAKD